MAQDTSKDISHIYPSEKFDPDQEKKIRPNPEEPYQPTEPDEPDVTPPVIDDDDTGVNPDDLDTDTDISGLSGDAGLGSTGLNYTGMGDSGLSDGIGGGAGDEPDDKGLGSDSALGSDLDADEDIGSLPDTSTPAGNANGSRPEVKSDKAKPDFEGTRNESHRNFG
jgi:hypothetical protein